MEPTVYKEMKEAIGMEKDPIAYKNFKKLRKYAEEAGLKAEFEEVPGFSHEWRFWDRTIQKALCRFLPDEEGHGNKF